MTTPRPLPVGDRIQPTAIETKDHAAVAVWSHDSEYMRTMRTQAAAPETPEQIMKWMTRETEDPNRFTFAIRLNDAPEMIGLAVLNEIEWTNRSGWLAIGIGPSEHRGQGFGSEAIGLLLEFAFDELNLHRLGLTVMSYNERGSAPIAGTASSRRASSARQWNATASATTCLCSGGWPPNGPGEDRAHSNSRPPKATRPRPAAS